MLKIEETPSAHSPFQIILIFSQKVLYSRFPEAVIKYKNSVRRVSFHYAFSWIEIFQETHFETATSFMK
jgi:hypothetical protein